MNTERALIFKNTPITIISSLGVVFIMGVGVYCYFKINGGAVPVIMIFLVGLLGLGYFLLIQPYNVMVSSIGISQNAVFGAWDVRWNQIKGWNVVSLGNNKTTIWFRTGANVYRIRPEVFRKNELENLKAYFEKYCGQQLEGESRLSLSFFRR